MRSTEFPGQPIHHRTTKGKMLIVSRPSSLDRSQTFLLALFNGFTPTHHLIRLASKEVPDAVAVVEQLERQGLIEQVI